MVIILSSIHIWIILTDDNKCAIDYCEKCYDKNKCEICKEGYTLNFAQTKCFDLIKKSNEQSGSSKKSSFISAEKLMKSSSSGSVKNTPSGSAKESSATHSGWAKIIWSHSIK